MRTIQFAFLSVLIFFCMKMKAQEILSSGGDYFNNGINSLSSTIGEPVTETFSGTVNILTQGFQQSIIMVLSIEESLKSDLIISAFPNPAKAFIKIYVENASHEHLSYKLYDSYGKLMLQSQFETNETEIPVYQLSPASYILKVLADHKEIKEFKLIKQ